MWSRRTTAVAAGILVLGATLGAGTIDGELVGAESCATCHTDAYEAWKAGPHRITTTGLTDLQVADTRCARCHAPAQSAGFTGVQCETCHGGGQYYARDYVMRDEELVRRVGLQDVTSQTCEQCHDHNAPGLRPFDFDAFRARIKHWPDEPEG